MSVEACYIPDGPVIPSPCGRCGDRWGVDVWEDVTCKGCLRAKSLAEKPYKDLQAEVERLRGVLGLILDAVACGERREDILDQYDEQAKTR